MHMKTSATVSLALSDVQIGERTILCDRGNQFRWL